MKIYRRTSQLFFFLFFVFLFLNAHYPYNPLVPSEIFLNISPLAAISTMLATRSIVPSMLVAGILLLLTVLLGRFFCGWICPLGTIIDTSDRLFKKKTKKSYNYLKYIVLIVVFMCALFSLQLAWVFDPISILTRFFVVVVFPTISICINAFFSLLFSTSLFEDQVYFLYEFSQQFLSGPLNVLSFSSLFVFLFFITILLFGFFSPRFWCKSVCPLGALLGLFSKYRITNRFVYSTCNDCCICQNKCKMAAIEKNNSDTSSSECILCGNCVSVCDKRSVRFAFGTKKERRNIDFSRRHFVYSGLSGMTALALIKVLPFKKNQSKNIRPPGSVVEEHFLDKCIRCLECVKICSTTGGCLQPSIFESGLEGLWSPVSKANLGYCEYNCNLCGQVCPTGAIKNIPVEVKQKLVMGVAYFIEKQCIPYAEFEDCLVCQEHCPTPDKAIKFELKNVKTPDGVPKSVKIPFVLKELCIGCGICEFKCPVKESPGIALTNNYEQRL